MIVLTRFDAEDGLLAEAVMHELAHVVVGKDPNHVVEYESMLAIEHEAHRRLRLDWRGWMANYAVGDKWPDTPTLKRGEWLAEAYEYAEADGLMRGRKPTYRKRAPEIRR